MDSAQPNQSILETLRTVEFRLGLKGYNVDEVDEYLEKAAVEAESVQEQLRGMTERVQRANERIGQLELELQRAPSERPLVEAPAREPSVTDDTLQRTLLLAQKFVDQTKRESEAEAADIVSRAEERARNLVGQAEERARQVTTEAEERLREEVSRLEGMRTRLAADVEGMARHLEEQRTKIRASLTEVLKWVDERLQPASAVMAVRPRPDARGDDAGTRHAPPAQEGPARSPDSARGTEPGGGAPDRRVTSGDDAPTGQVERPPSVSARLGNVDAPTQLGELFDNGQHSE